MLELSLVRTITGAIIWVGLLLAGFWLLPKSPDRVEHPLPQIGKYLLNSRLTLQLRFPEECVVMVGDPIYYDGGTQIVPIGRVIRLKDYDDPETYLAWTDHIEIELFSNAPKVTSEMRFHYLDTPSSLEWVLSTMLPESKRVEIGNLIVDSLQAHREELWGDLQPLLASVLNESQTVIMEDFQIAFAKRQTQVGAISQKYREEFVETEVVPVFEQVVLPIVQQEAGDLVQVIGSELWSQASVWGLTWRYIYDRSPLPQRDLTRKEFERFVNEKAIPIFESHSDDILDVQEKIFRRLSAHPEMASLFNSLLSRVARDEDLRQLVAEILREVIIDNPRLRDVWISAWNSNEMHELMAKVNDRLGPTVTKIGESLFGNPRTAITPEFSRVLRNRVMFKDLRFLVLATDPTAVGPQEVVVLGKEFQNLPIHLPSHPR